MQKLGWHLTFVKIGSATRIVTFNNKVAKYCCFKIIFQVTSFPQAFRTLELRILNQTSLHMSNQKIRALSNASKPTIVQDSSNELLIGMTKE